MRLNKLKLYRIMRMARNLFAGLIVGWVTGAAIATWYYGDLESWLWRIIFVAFFWYITSVLFLAWSVAETLECGLCPGREEAKRILRREQQR